MFPSEAFDVPVDLDPLKLEDLEEERESGFGYAVASAAQRQKLFYYQVKLTF